jgi:ABC-2 type transport system ATP-binding protein
MIEAKGLSKRYGDKLAVNDLSFTVRPGIVTGFLGPNGAGKSTTMRMILGLDRPTAGEALAGPTRRPAHPCSWSVPCWTRRRSTAAAPPAPT